MKLTNKLKEELWGGSGPYSQVNLIIQSRILDDSVSRVFIEVEVEINPLTFKIISQNRKQFRDDQTIIQLLDHAEFRGQEFGYVSHAFSGEYRNESVLRRAEKTLEYSKETVIKMHKFVMDLLELNEDKS